MNRKLLHMALACGNMLLPALRRAAMRRKIRAPHPDILLTGGSECVGIRLTMQDRYGSPYTSVEIVRMGRPASADPRGPGANSDHPGEVRTLRNVTRAG